MVRKYKDLKGQGFGNLTVVKYIGNDRNRKALWQCKCSCGNETIVRANDLINGRQKTCGCSKLTQNGLSSSRLYTTWSNMKRRCYNSNSKDYKYYGSRGISICNEWLDEDLGFISFYNWAMQSCYKDNLTIDRIDNDGNYSPSNCRWITIEEQQNNKRNNHLVNYKSKSYTISQISKMTNIPRNHIEIGIANGFSVEEIVHEHHKAGVLE